MRFGSILFCSRCHWRRWGEVCRGSKQGKSWELKVPTGPLCMMAMAHSGRLRKAIASLDDIHEWLYEMMIWWFEFGQRNFHQKLQDNHHDQAGERESPFDESRRQGRLFWRGFQLQKSSDRVLWSAQLEIVQPQSCCFPIHQLKPLFLQAILYDVYCYAKDSAIDTKGYSRSNIMTQDGCFACLTCNMRNEKENHCEGVHWDGCVLIE